MEVKIKTQEELRNSRITLELVGDQNEVAMAIDRIKGISTYGSEAAAEVMAENYVRAQEKIRELETERNIAINLAKDRETRINSLENRIINLGEYQASAEAERDRLLADRGSRQRLLTEAIDKIEAVRHILTAPLVTESRDGIVTSAGAVLSDAIGNALAALDA